MHSGADWSSSVDGQLKHTHTNIGYGVCVGGGGGRVVGERERKKRNSRRNTHAGSIAECDERRFCRSTSGAGSLMVFVQPPYTHTPPPPPPPPHTEWITLLNSSHLKCMYTHTQVCFALHNKRCGHCRKKRKKHCPRMTCFKIHRQQLLRSRDASTPGKKEKKKRKEKKKIQTILVLFELAQAPWSVIKQTSDVIWVVCNKLTTVWAPTKNCSLADSFVDPMA